MIANKFRKNGILIWMKFEHTCISITNLKCYSYKCNNIKAFQPALVFKHWIIQIFDSASYNWNQIEIHPWIKCGTALNSVETCGKRSVLIWTIPVTIRETFLFYQLFTVQANNGINNKPKKKSKYRWWWLRLPFKTWID